MNKCRKEAFSTRKLAKLYLKKTRKKVKGVKFRVYLCPECGEFHYTGMNSFEIQKTRVIIRSTEG